MTALASQPISKGARLSRRAVLVLFGPGFMLRRMAHTHHAIDYIEIAVEDLIEGKRFYREAFGWNFTDYGPGYAGIQHPGGEGEVGGMAETGTKPTGSDGPLVVIFSQDLEASLALVQAAGGRITKEPFVFPGGRRFGFADPSGNELAVWSES